MEILSDIEIARKAKMLPIVEIAAKILLKNTALIKPNFLGNGWIQSKTKRTVI